MFTTLLKYIRFVTVVKFSSELNRLTQVLAVYTADKSRRHVEIHNSSNQLLEEFDERKIRYYETYSHNEGTNMSTFWQQN